MTTGLRRRPHSQIRPETVAQRRRSRSRQRIIIPAAHRIDYVTALNAFSRNAQMTPLLRTLGYAQRYTHATDWSTLDHARGMLEESGAFGTGEGSKLRVNWQKSPHCRPGDAGSTAAGRRRDCRPDPVLMITAPHHLKGMQC